MKIISAQFQKIVHKSQISFSFRNLLLSIYLSSCATSIPKQSVGQVDITFQVFYDELSPYGSWMNNAEYGYVWRPSNRNNFFPYGNNGYWLYTDFGWTWVSTYRWGWAPFHYGRWFYDSFYGWVWVPGYEWSPAWVNWRESPGYYGWAPLSPGISFGSAFDNNYYLPYDRWRFINQRDIGRRDIYKHYKGLGGYSNYLQQSRSINNLRFDQSKNFSYHSGPQINEVEKITGQKYIPVRVKTLKTPAQIVTKKELQIFRPNINSIPKEKIKPKYVEEWNGKSNVPIPKSLDIPQKSDQENRVEEKMKVQQDPRIDPSIQNKPVEERKEIQQQQMDKQEPRIKQPIQNKPVEQRKEIQQQQMDKQEPRIRQFNQNNPVEQRKEVQQQQMDKQLPRIKQPIKQPKDVQQQPMYKQKIEQQKKVRKPKQ